MKILNLEQGSEEWLKARLGIPTASEFGNIITSQGKPSTSVKTYMNKKLAEWVIGDVPDGYTNDWMLRGQELEVEARDAYEFIHGGEPRKVGLILRDDELAGCSPDCLIGENGGLEIKCPAPHTHVEYLLSGKLPAKYKPQVQGCMYITGRKWWDFVSYHPEMKPLILRVERDEKYISLMDEQINKFIDDMLKKRELLTERVTDESS